MDQSENTSLLDSLSSNFPSTTNDFDTLKIFVKEDEWVQAATKLKDEYGLSFFSWLSAVDWENDVSVGDPPKENVDPSFEILCCLSDTSDGNFVILSTTIDKTNPTISTLVNVFPGASWHEREAYEMFGISFEGHPNLIKLYLPDGFEGNPLLKSYELLTREVKPWPGEVDVEPMPESDEEIKGDDEQ